MFNDIFVLTATWKLTCYSERRFAQSWLKRAIFSKLCFLLSPKSLGFAERCWQDANKWHLLLQLENMPLELLICQLWSQVMFLFRALGNKYSEHMNQTTSEKMLIHEQYFVLHPQSNAKLHLSENVPAKYREINTKVKKIETVCWPEAWTNKH